MFPGQVVAGRGEQRFQQKSDCKMLLSDYVNGDRSISCLSHWLIHSGRTRRKKFKKSLKEAKHKQVQERNKGRSAGNLSDCIDIGMTAIRSLSDLSHC